MACGKVAKKQPGLACESTILPGFFLCKTDKTQDRKNDKTQGILTKTQGILTKNSGCFDQNRGFSFKICNIFAQNPLHCTIKKPGVVGKQYIDTFFPLHLPTQQ